MSSKKQRLENEEAAAGPSSRSTSVSKKILFLDEHYLEEAEEITNDPLVSTIVDYDPEFLESESDEEENEPLREGFAQDKLPSGLYGCWLLVATRNFKGHSSGKEVGRWGVAGNSVIEFIQNCWQLSQKFLKREVLFKCDESGIGKPVWSEKIGPEEKDFVEFALFNDKTSHRTLRPDQLTETILQNWRTKEIHLLLHVYSTSVNNKAVFQSVQELLLGKGSADKSGAASNSTIDALAKKLRDIHGHWEAHHIAWIMWANVISVSESHVQETMIHEAPPAHLIKLFQTKEQPRLQSVARNFSMAHSVNQGYQDDVLVIRRSYDQLEGMLSNVNKGMKLLKNQIELMESRAAMGESFISAAEQAVLVDETSFSASLASKVIDA
ncbi:uncharacterized protein LOC129729867 [Wyeomyia smithii]|uniref:uncharacterized protein LOC129729867 n=1 Tax=Wyeomyia smithii TaxID=174621 RepID=UPI002467B289|nr:uncharacterized protein LOC129729867 [Wyeomyia smithii]